MPLPKTKKNSNLSLEPSFYRKFIPNFADIVSPINALLKKFSCNRLEWSDEQVEGVQVLKQKLAESPIPTFPDYKKSFYLRTDASDTGLGAILMQKVDDLFLPMSYASRTFLDRERKYAVIERECLGIVWPINKFNSYLHGREFILQTDQQPLTYIRNMRNSNGRHMRWSLVIEAYSFIIEYNKGSENIDADVLSRCSSD